ncbi:uncharacterized protein DC041_0009708 [Schistosoma bovis]|uniref:Uncharacterized protein n=1 Tax=Schistosoma bovis TaxID=6184 RepID=A0A430QFX9_SCHBO|nr:uncharacterized protein DC041_0009708 [Schistosoma bovis]
MRRETGMTVLELSKLANLYKIPASLLFSIEVTECFPSDIIAPSFWTVLAERRAFVTKGCTTTSACQMTSSVISERCSRSKTRDWICSYCCNSDRCNYYVPGGALRVWSSHTYTTFFIICLCSIFWKFV